MSWWSWWFLARRWSSRCSTGRWTSPGDRPLLEWVFDRWRYKTQWIYTSLHICSSYSALLLLFKERIQHVISLSKRMMSTDMMSLCENISVWTHTDVLLSHEVMKSRIHDHAVLLLLWRLNNYHHPYLDAAYIKCSPSYTARDSTCLFIINSKFLSRTFWSSAPTD